MWRIFCEFVRKNFRNTRNNIIFIWLLYLFLKARARLEMREKASQQDAHDVVEIMKYSILDTFSDDFGNLDFQRSQHGSGMSSRAQVSLNIITAKGGVSQCK